MWVEGNVSNATQLTAATRTSRVKLRESLLSAPNNEPDGISSVSAKIN